jgi:hypothetical protein
MEIFTRLLLDALLLLTFALFTFAIDFALIFLSGGMLRLKLLNFELLLDQSPNYKFYSFLVNGSLAIFLASPSIIVGYFLSKFLLLNHFFDLYDIASISLTFFMFIFLYMGGNDMLINIETIDDSKKSGYYTRTLWEEIDLSLTPAIIHTLLVMLGMLITYYQFK